MDALMDHRHAVDEVVAGRRRPRLSRLRVRAQQRVHPEGPHPVVRLRDPRDEVVPPSAVLVVVHHQVVQRVAAVRVAARRHPQPRPLRLGDHQGRARGGQAVYGGAVGNAQQGLGEAHQGDALLARQGELVHQLVDAAGALALGPQGLHQQASAGLDGGGVGPDGADCVHQRGDEGGLVGPAMAGDRLAMILQGGAEGGVSSHGRGLGERRSGSTPKRDIGRRPGFKAGQRAPRPARIVFQ